MQEYQYVIFNMNESMAPQPDTTVCSMMSMLTDGNALEKIQRLRNKDSALANKLREQIQKLSAEIKKEQIKGNQHSLHTGEVSAINREILSNALMTAAQTEREKERLTQYQKKIEEVAGYERKNIKLTE